MLTSRAEDRGRASAIEDTHRWSDRRSVRFRTAPPVGTDRPATAAKGRRPREPAMTHPHQYAATPTANDAIIRAEGVVKTYDTGTTKVQALRGIDFAVGRGEMVAVMGPSGCGKTTLLNCLSGLDDVDAGRILV